MKPLVSILFVVMRFAPRAVHTQTRADEAAAGKLP